MSRICPGCNKPMVEGQAFNGLLKCHWDCTEATKEALGHETAEEVERSAINARLASDGIFKGHHMYEKLGGT